MVATNLRGGKRLALLAVLFTAFTVYILSKFSRSHTTCHAARSLYQLRSFSEENHTSSSSSSYYLNLNSLNATAQAAERGERLLVLTPLLSRADAADHLERYFDLLDKTTYPNRLISIGLLITDSMDGALEVVEAQVKRLENRWFNRFHEIHVYTRDFPFLQSTAQDTIAYRRTVMARARNFLLASALRDYHSWVAWLDVDLVQYPATIFDDLMRVSHADVIVPNCLMFRTDQCFWAYDRSNWQDTDYSLERQKHFGQDYVFVEGYTEEGSGRSLLVDMPTHLGPDYRVPLDGVGASFLLVKSHVHREGANFPAFAYQHLVEAEAFGKVANAMGFSVYGVPGYIVYHAERK